MREVLADLRVAEFLDAGPAARPLRPGDRLGVMLDRLSGAEHLGLPVADADGRYLGMVSLEEIHTASRLPGLGELVVAADLMNTGLPVLRRGDPLDRALELFAESDRVALAVVSDDAESRVLGLVRRADISTAYLRRVQGMGVGPGSPGQAPESA